MIIVVFLTGNEVIMVLIGIVAVIVFLILAIATYRIENGGIVLLKGIYVVFLALIIALFFGLGIEAFYPQPQEPQYPIQSQQIDEKGKATTGPTQEQIEYEKKMRDYQENIMKPYNRNVAIIALILAVLTMSISLLFAGKFILISDGMLLGGVFTLIYSIIRGLSAENAQFSFIIVSIGLFITVFLGYWKFLKPNIAPSEK